MPNPAAFDLVKQHAAVQADKLEKKVVDHYNVSHVSTSLWRLSDQASEFELELVDVLIRSILSNVQIHVAKAPPAPPRWGASPDMMSICFIVYDNVIETDCVLQSKQDSQTTGKNSSTPAKETSTAQLQKSNSAPAATDEPNASLPTVQIATNER